MAFARHFVALCRKNAVRQFVTSHLAIRRESRRRNPCLA